MTGPKMGCGSLASFIMLFFSLLQPSGVPAQDSSNIEIFDPFPKPNIPADFVNARDHLAKLVREERWHEARGLAHELVWNNTNDPIIFYWLGGALLKLNDPIGAIQAMRSAERRGLDNALLHEALGTAYYNINQYILFKQQMEKAIKLDPTRYEPFYYLGSYLESIHSDFAGALEFFEKAVQRNPDHIKSWYHKGFCLEALGRRSGAYSTYETAIQLVEKKHERFSLPYQSMARLLLQIDEPGPALRFARTAVELEPNLDSSHLVMAKVYERLGKLAEAVEELRAAVRLNPTNALPRYVLSRIYTKLGNREAAQAELKIFKKINRHYGPQ